MLISHDEIRKQIDKHIFKRDGIVMAEIKIRKLEEAFDEVDRPQALRDALSIAETEKVLLQRMKDTDPELLKSDTQGIIDVERIRETFYSVSQNKFDPEA